MVVGLGLTTGTVTSLLDRLERRGLVARWPDPDDRRGVIVSPTEAMFASLDPLYRPVARRLAALAQDYRPDEAAGATRHLRDVTAAVEAVADGV